MTYSLAGVIVLSAFPLPLSSFVAVPALGGQGKAGHDQPTSTCVHLAGGAFRGRGGASRRQWDGGAVSSFSLSDPPSSSSSSSSVARFAAGRGAWRPLRIGMGDCPSEEECEIVYDDDDDVDVETGGEQQQEQERRVAGESKGRAEELPAAEEAPPPTPPAGPAGSEKVEAVAADVAAAAEEKNSGSDSDTGSGKGGDGTGEGAEGPQSAAAEGGQPGGTAGLGPDREGLEHREKVLDDGYEKQEQVKWREAQVVDNAPASADDRCRLITLSLVRHEGLEHDFSRATWLENYKVPGQFVGIRLDEGGDGGMAGCLVAVSTEPTSVRQNGGTVQILVTEEPSFRLKGDTRGPAEEARGRSLAALEKGDRVKMSDFMGRGFASLFVGWIGLQSALQEQRDIVIVASGARGLGSVKPVLDWPPVQAHAGIRKVSVFLEAESPATAPFMDDFGGWRSSGIRVTQCFTAKTNENPVNVEEAIFSQGSGLAGAVGGNPGAASFLMAGLPGKRAMQMTDRLTDHGVDPSRLLFNDFF